MIDKTKIFRITFRVRVNQIPLIGEVHFKTQKEKWDIDHEAIIEAYLKAADHKVSLDCIIDSQELK
jgi:hypothetical protein